MRRYSDASPAPSTSLDPARLPMATYDLSNLAELKAACDSLPPPTGDWLEALAETLRHVQEANQDERATPEFQLWLWEENRVAAVGQGKISVESAIADPEFRKWLAAVSVAPQPDDPVRRVAELQALYEELVERLGSYCTRIPHLKIFRVLAALYPAQVTTVADRRAARVLFKAMGGKRLDGIERHAWILSRLDEALGPCGDSAHEMAQRMILPWMLYARHVKRGDEPTEIADDTSGQTRLRPLPAARRRRGLTALSGGFTTILSILDFVGEGVAREELMDHLRSLFPENKDSTLSVVISSLLGEFAVVRRDGDQYVLTERAEAVLETQDPSDLADWLLTHVLGVDHAIVLLRDEGPKEQVQLVRDLQRVNPGWTSTYVPTNIVRWLLEFGVADRQGADLVLSDTGREWAARIDWEPEALPPAEPAVPIEVEDTAASLGRIRLPSLDVVIERVSEHGSFANALVANLHAGLWAHDRRHFAILTGLSGSGKTLLACGYGRALHETGDSPARLCTVPVQPGWYDPGALLGYVNPLRGDSYVRTAFLEFLLRASSQPEDPFVAVFDEMNLSHPEQYMAPLLSAMETGDSIRLHSEGERLDGVPASVPYPSNLALIGTVNMDETTHGLSDKVLDRAFTLEFWQVDLDAYPRWGKRDLPAEAESKVREALGELLAALEPARLHFGWRVVDDVLDFVAFSASGVLSLEEALDSVVYAKIVPKLRGEDSPRVREALAACSSVLDRHGLVDSCRKVRELSADLESTGSTRFWR